MEAPVVLMRECLTWTGGSVCQELVRRLPRAQRRAARNAMLHAAQELLVTTLSKSSPPPDVVSTNMYVEWRFDAVSYIYLPKPDDRIFRIHAKARKRAKSVVLIIPPRHEQLVREALERRRREDYFSVFTVDDYLAWRTMFVGADARWSRKKVILWLLSRYNRFVRRGGFPQSLLVRLESAPSARESWRR